MKTTRIEGPPVAGTNPGGHENIDLGAAIKMKFEFNRSRPHRHGGKRS
jgi:hypothetical protein